MPKWLRRIIDWFRSPAGQRATEIAVDLVEDEIERRQKKPPTPPSKR